MLPTDSIVSAEINACNAKSDNTDNAGIKSNAAEVTLNIHKSHPDIYDILPANGHDMYNYQARYKLANFQIQNVLTFDGNLDFDILARAVRLSVDAEPVLGCRFIEDDPPYWKRLENLDEATFCYFEETDNAEAAVKKFLNSPLSMDQDPMVKAKLFRCGQKDILCIKINHACSDAQGTKDYIRLLSDIYTTIENSGQYVPKPGTRGRLDQDRMFHALGISDPLNSGIPFPQEAVPTWPFPWKQVKQQGIRTSVSKLPRGFLDTMNRYAKKKGATINDLILTALYRAMSGMGIPDYGKPMEIALTVDLRRYLPNNRAESIRCFSGSEKTSLKIIPFETFGQTLSRVIPIMNRIKSEKPGLKSAIGLEAIEKSEFKKECENLRKLYNEYINSPYLFSFVGFKCLPVLSNVGYISPSLIKFGSKTVTDAYMVGPAVSAPALLILPSSYNGTLTLTVCHYKSAVSKRVIEMLLTLIKYELIYGCK